MPFFAKAILTFSMKTLLVLLTASMCLLHEVRSSPSPFVVLSALSVPAVPAAGAKILLDYERTRIRFMRNIGGPNQEEYSSIGGETIPNIEKDIKEIKANQEKLVRGVSNLTARFDTLEEETVANFTRINEQKGNVIVNNTTQRITIDT